MNEVKFEEWVWEEELEKLKLEHIAFGNYILNYRVSQELQLKIIFSAMIIVGVGLAISSFVFIVELIVFKFRG